MLFRSRDKWLAAEEAADYGIVDQVLADVPEQLAEGHQSEDEQEEE